MALASKIRARIAWVGAYPTRETGVGTEMTLKDAIPQLDQTNTEREIHKQTIERCIRQLSLSSVAASQRQLKGWVSVRARCVLSGHCSALVAARGPGLTKQSSHGLASNTHRCRRAASASRRASSMWRCG